MHWSWIALLALPSASALTAVATFASKAGYPDGTITFTQTNADADVMMSVAMNSVPAGGAKYHIHVFSTDGGATGYGSTACGAKVTGGHYNPNFGSPAGPTKEAGDLSGLFEPMTAGSYANNFVVDKDAATKLTLFGRDTIVGRSIVLHQGAQNERLVCATIGDKAKAGASVAFAATGAPTGKMLFFQTEPGRTTISVDMQGLEAGATTGGWHIHQYWAAGSSAASSSFDGCSAEQTGGHYNPAGRTATSVPLKGLGELSAKFGNLYDATGAVQKIYEDNNMNVKDIIGRSIVVHKGKPRWSCGALELAGTTGSTTYATAPPEPKSYASGTTAAMVVMVILSILALIVGVLRPSIFNDLWTTVRKARGGAESDKSVRRRGSQELQGRGAGGGNKAAATRNPLSPATPGSSRDNK